MWPQFLRIAIPGLTIAGVHVSVVTGHHVYALAVLAGAAALHTLLAILTHASARAIAAPAAVTVVLAGAQAFALLENREMARLAALPPVLIHGWLAWLFGQTLLPGREPLIRRFSRLHRPYFPPELEGYTRRLTVMWTAMLGTMTVVSAVLGLYADPSVWSWSVNIAMPGISAAVFLVEHAYRSFAYRHLGGNSPVDTLRTLLRPETWTAS